MSLGELIGMVLGFNLLSFGNGPVMIPLLQSHLVDTGILSLDQFLYAYAVGRATPGQANLYVAAIGYLIFGWVGAVAMIVAIQLPGYLVLPLTRLHARYSEVEAVRGFTRGLISVSVGLMFYVAYDIGRESLTSIVAATVFVATVAVIMVLRWNPLVGMLAGAALGLALKLATAAGLFA